MKAIIIGATGATGIELLNILLIDQNYTEIILFVRRKCGLNHPKLIEVLTDFDKLENVAEYIFGDVLFSCFGTTLKDAGSKYKQWYVDYSIPSKFAEIAKSNGVFKIVLISAYGASPSNKIFYLRIKGKLEEKIISLAFDQCIIFRPGLLSRKNTKRMGERIIAEILNFMNKIGFIIKYRPLPTSILAEKMSKSTKVLGAGNHVIELEKIFAL